MQRSILIIFLLGITLAAFPGIALGDTGTPIPPENLPAFYQPLFASPYEYMFQSDKKSDDLHINGKSLGMFMAGIRGILFYFSFTDCTAQMAGVNKTTLSYDDVSTIERVSGLKVYLKQSTCLEDFSRFNPDIIAWGHTNLIPKPADKIAGVTFKEIYAKVFKRFFRLMTQSYLFLQADKALEIEGKAYLEQMKEKKFEALAYLDQRFKEALSDFQIAADGTKMTPSMALGFWIRRHLDQTDAELWKGLQKLMNLYDQEWLESIKTRY